MSTLQNLERVFELVCQCEPELRDEILDSECQGDAELKKQIVTMLAADSQLNWLNDSVSLSQMLELEVPHLGSMIGSYLLREEIGRGGMGVVFLAEQKSPIKRSVALKVILGGASSEEVIARFEAEKQALAVFDHPNLTKIFDSGVSDQGHLYFAMDYVDGVSITEYCDQHRLSLEERLRMFLNVADAVAHAHQRGIIHRDIKPSNVLVQESASRRTPKVIDFGISKALDAELNNIGEAIAEKRYLAGTPQYMSPEQVEMRPGTVDVRADVYSLGVLLYELMTGTTPLVCDKDPSDIVAACDSVLQAKVESPLARVTGWAKTENQKTQTALTNRSTSRTQLIRYLKPDLNAIIMRAINRDPEQRYSTVESFQSDLKNFLAFRPVSAMPASGIDRARKLIKRNQAVAVLSAATCLIVVVAFATATVSRWKERIARIESTEIRSQLVASEWSRTKAMRRAKLGDQLRNRLAERRKNKVAQRRAVRRWLSQGPFGGSPNDDFQESQFLGQAIYRQFGMTSVSPWEPLSQHPRLPLLEEIVEEGDATSFSVTVGIEPASSFFPFSSPETWFTSKSMKKSALKFCRILIEEQRVEFNGLGETLANSYDIQTQLMMDLKKYSQAIESAEHAIRIREESNKEANLPFSKLLLAEALQIKGEHKRAKCLVAEIQAERANLIVAEDILLFERRINMLIDALN